MNKFNIIKDTLYEIVFNFEYINLWTHACSDATEGFNHICARQYSLDTRFKLKY